MGFLRSLFGKKKTVTKNEADTKSAQDYLELGETAIVQGETNKGIGFLRQAYKKDNKTLNKIFNIAAFLDNGAEKLNRQAGGGLYFSAGLRELDIAIAIMGFLCEVQPGAADIWYNFGLYCDHRGYFQEAINGYQKAAALDPEGRDGADALGNLGLLYSNKAKGILGKKKGEIGLSVFDFQNPDFVTAEKYLLQSIEIAKKIFSKDGSYRSELIKKHRFIRDFYTGIVSGNKAIENCLEIHRLHPQDEEAISWLKQAEKHTKKQLLPVKEEADSKKQVPGFTAKDFTVKNWCPKCRSTPATTLLTIVENKRLQAGLCPACEANLINMSQVWDFKRN